MSFWDALSIEKLLVASFVPCIKHELIRQLNSPVSERKALVTSPSGPTELLLLVPCKLIRLL